MIAPIKKFIWLLKRLGTKNVSIKLGVNSLVVVKNGTFVVDPGPHRGYIDQLFKTINKYK